MTEPLPPRVARHLSEGGWLAPGARVVVAVSGGLDSLVLLHLIRFAGVAPGVAVHGAHFDHGMRGDSHRDAVWLRGIAWAWDLPLELGRAVGPLRSQAEARSARYAFLRRVRRERGARWILTAHHADDQAETVLHRVLRGTGLEGLQGIPRVGGEVGAPPDLLRPLLPFWRPELEGYARQARIRPREDPTNPQPSYARNVIRNELLPRAEAAVAPGARQALVRLAELARENEEAWSRILARLEEELVLESSPDRVVVGRSALLGHSPPVRVRILRRLLAHFGVRPTRTGTEAAAEFSTTGRSGRGVDLPGGLVLRREYDRLVLGPAPRSEGDRRVPGSFPRRSGSVRIPAAEPGTGVLSVGGRTFRVGWGSGPPPSRGWTAHFPRSHIIHFPLEARGWKPGDRVRLPIGTRKLAKVFGERRIPRRERHRLPVLVDAHDRVLWVPGVIRAVESEEEADGPPEAREPFWVHVARHGDDESSDA